MRKWKARLREAKVDKKTHGSKREREVSAEIDTALGLWDPKAGRARKLLPVDVIVVGYEPSTSLLLRRLKESTEDETELVETKEQSSSFQDGHDSQKSVSELDEQASKDQEGCGRTRIIESCMLAHSASELLAIRNSSGGTPSIHDADVDLIAASYLLRIVSQSPGMHIRPHLNCGNVHDTEHSSLIQRQGRQPAIHSTLITAPQNLIYNLHNLSTNHDPAAKHIAPFLSTARHAFITIDLACVANTGPLTKQPRILTLLELSKSIPYRFDIFLAFINVEHLEKKLSSTEQRLDPNSYTDFESNVHKATPSLLNNASYSAVYRYLNSLFADVQHWEVAILPSPPPTDPAATRSASENNTLSHLSSGCRATLDYILSRFVRIHDPYAVKVYPCLLDISDNSSLRKLLTLFNDVLISENLIVMSCFCTGAPSAETYGPIPGRFNF